MFWKKKADPQSPAESPRRGMSMDSARPQPILKTAPDQGGGPSIRFVGGGTPRHNPSPTPSPAPTHVQPQRSPQRVSPTPVNGQNYPTRPESTMSFSQQAQTQLHQPTSSSNPAIQRIQGPRRSSRPSSPSASSFGARVPPGPQLRQAAPLSTPPMMAADHVTTPPSLYVSSITSRAGPPPSPYRPTSERRGLQGESFASRPPRVSSLFETPNAPGRYGMTLGDRTPTQHSREADDEDLPTFNFIPATPLNLGDEWNMKRSASGSALERAFPVEEMVDVPLETSYSAPLIMRDLTMETIEEGLPASDSLPAIANLEFSPFDMNVSLPSMGSGSSISSLPYSVGDEQANTSYTAPLLSTAQCPPNEPLPSPPFESYPSLPSLDSEPSLRSSASQSSLPSSCSNSSLASYSDVEEALGSMLASLSDPSMPPVPSISRMDKMGKSSSNPGLGLGLSLPPSASITAPLSPRRKGPPPPLDLTHTNRTSAGPDLQSAPARINHRVAFYTTARAAPNSGSFFNSANGQTEFIVPSPTRSDSGSSLSSDETQLANSKEAGGWRDSMRSSISFGSEASDDDPYTASIVCLTPVKGGGVAALCREEYLMEAAHEVGLAL